MTDETTNPIEDQIESLIASEDYVTFPSGKVVCDLTLHDGRSFDGNSGIDPVSEEEGKRLARDHARSKLWSGRIR